MQFRVTGTDHATGRRATLEVDAGSKAGAERTARGRGIDVQHIEAVESGVEHHGSRHRGEDQEPPRRGMVWIAIVLALLGGIGYAAWRFGYIG